jgi:hypothetical protein
MIAITTNSSTSVNARLVRQRLVVPSFMEKPASLQSVPPVDWHRLALPAFSRPAIELAHYREPMRERLLHALVASRQADEYSAFGVTLADLWTKTTDSSRESGRLRP